MAERFVNVDRETPMLLPPDLREWVAENDLVRLVVEAVNLCPLSAARTNSRGTGSEQYPPSMMLALLIYSYASGVFSSRRIERATFESVAVRFICGNHHPDHDTIAVFRRSNAELFKRCFSEVVLLARESGLLKLGNVSLDGTRLAGAGGRRALRSLEEIERELQELAEELLAQAEGADEKDPDAGGTQLPSELGDTRRRQQKLLEARERLLERRREAEGGREITHVCVSEPESRTLRRRHGESLQGYNAQMSADAGPSGLIVGAHLSQEANDSAELLAGIGAIVAQAGAPEHVLVDKGYDNTEAIAVAESQHAVQVLCPPVRRPNAKELNPKRKGRDARIWRLRREMEKRFEEPAVRALYRRRRTTAEAPFHRIKNLMGFRRFHCWGIHAAGAEWQLVCLAHNLRVLNGTSRRNRD